MEMFFIFLAGFACGVGAVIVIAAFHDVRGRR